MISHRWLRNPTQLDDDTIEQGWIGVWPVAVPRGRCAAPVPDDHPVLNNAFQDHIAYVATFAMPVVIESCNALKPGYLNKTAPAYFRYVNARQDQIERGRLLTLAELAPGETLQA